MPTTNEPTDHPDPSMLMLDSFENGRLLTVERTADGDGPQVVTGLATSLHLASRSFEMTAIRPYNEDAKGRPVVIRTRIGLETVRTIRRATIRLLLEIDSEDLTGPEIVPAGRDIGPILSRLCSVQTYRPMELRPDADDDGLRVRFVEITGLTEAEPETDA